jgi:hypothetical protein
LHNFIKKHDLKKEEVKKFQSYAATYVSNPERESIISEVRLSFWVRNGSRRFPYSIAT